MTFTYPAVFCRYHQRVAACVHGVQPRSAGTIPHTHVRRGNLRSKALYGTLSTLSR